MFNATRQRAFTLIELVATIMLIGILAAVAVPRLTGVGGVKAAGFSHSLAAALQHARKSAVAMRRNVCVALTDGDTLTFTRRDAGDVSDYSCDTTTLLLAGQNTHQLEAPSGVTIALSSGIGLAFNALGQPSQGVTWTVTGDDGSIHSVIVEADSGYVYAP
jgi:MSHA pilin protein MshC